MSDQVSEEKARAFAVLLIEISNLRMKLTHAPDAVLEANAFEDADADGEEIIVHALSSDDDLASIVQSISERLAAPGGLADVIAQPLTTGQEKALGFARGNAKYLDAYVARKAR